MVDSWGSDSEYNENYKFSSDFKSITWSNDYFKKINNILNCDLFDLYLDYNTFIKKYDIEDLLSNFLITNIKYYNSYFNINLDQTEISMFSICLANIPIDKNYKQKLDIYLKYDWSYNNIVLIFLNIIDNNNLELFKHVYDKYRTILDSKLISYSKIDYNIVNHSLLCSKSIFEYIYQDINIFKYIKSHIELNLYIDNSYDFLNKICNNIVKFNYDYETNQWNYNNQGYIYSLTTFMESCIQKTNNNYNYNNLIEIFILKINNFEIIDEYIALCIKNINFKLLNNYFEKRNFILKELNFNSLLHFLVNMFDRVNIYNNRIQNNIIKIWNLIFPNVQKYSLDYIKYYFNNNSINNIVAFKKSINIIKQIEPYINNWNKLDFCDYTPILDAIRYSKFETVTYMIKNYNIDLNVESVDYHTILSCALMNSDLRLIEYIYKIILNNINLINLIQLNKNRCITILRDYRIIPFKEYKKKFDIFISLCGISSISKIIDKLVIYKPFVKHVIEKYNYKLEIKKNNNFNNRKLLNCSKLNKEYLILVIDNIDYKKSNYDIIIEYISYSGCIDFIIEMFEYMLSKNNFKKIDILNCNCTTIFLKVYDNIKNNNCNKCRYHDNKNQYTKYINFMTKNIIKNVTSIFNTNYYSNFSDYDDICDILFKNGIYFIKYLFEPRIDDSKINNINSMCFIKLINLKRKPLSYEKTTFSLTFLNWAIVICKLKMFVRKRFNKFKKSFTSKLTNVNDDINFSSLCIHNLPTHLTPLDCFKPLHQTHRYISMKADGVYKKSLFNVYPNINVIEELEYEYEFIKDENMCYVFDDYDVILNLRNKHSNIPNKIYPYLNLHNYKDVLIEYNKLERSSIKNFINSEKFKKKWWAKYVFKIEDMCHSDYLKLLYGISTLELDCIDNDGWILCGKDCTYKIKPQKLLTIDLIYKFNKLYDKQNNL